MILAAWQSACRKLTCRDKTKRGDHDRDASNSNVDVEVFGRPDPEQDATNARRAGEAFCRAPRPGGAFFSIGFSIRMNINFTGNHAPVTQLTPTAYTILADLCLSRCGSFQVANDAMCGHSPSRASLISCFARSLSHRTRSVLGCVFALLMPSAHTVDAHNVSSCHAMSSTQRFA